MTDLQHETLGGNDLSGCALIRSSNWLAAVEVSLFQPDLRLVQGINITCKGATFPLRREQGGNASDHQSVHLGSIALSHQGGDRARSAHGHSSERDQSCHQIRSH